MTKVHDRNHELGMWVKTWRGVYSFTAWVEDDDGEYPYGFYEDEEMNDGFDWNDEGFLDEYRSARFYYNLEDLNVTPGYDAEWVLKELKKEADTAA